MGLLDNDLSLGFLCISTPAGHPVPSSASCYKEVAEYVKGPDRDFDFNKITPSKFNTENSRFLPPHCFLWSYNGCFYAVHLVKTLSRKFPLLMFTVEICTYNTYYKEVFLDGASISIINLPCDSKFEHRWFDIQHVYLADFGNTYIPAVPSDDPWHYVKFTS